MFKRWAKRRFLSLFAKRLPWHGRISFSQFGEDVAAHTLLKQYHIEQGFYLDIGAYHPVYLSNTYLFYQRGWSGITVEPTPGSAADFRAIRPRDTHLDCVVAPHAEAATVPFYCFAEQSPYNTLSEELARDHARRNACNYDTLHLPCLTATQILDRYLPTGRQLDLLCTDCEGMDAAILTTMDWPRHVPKVVVFEDAALDVTTSPLVRQLSGHGYEVFARIGPSTIMFRPPAKL